MRLKVLVDNNTLIDRYFIGEPGVSYYIEHDGKKILFDLGYSHAFLQNGAKMGVNFLDMDYIVISHSHLDHTWGMESLIKHYNEAKMEGGTHKRPTFIAHPDVFMERSFNGDDEFGMNIHADKVFKYMDNGLSKDPVWLSDKLVFLGEIPRTNHFEALQSIGEILVDGHRVDDFSNDDSALCYKSNDGLVIITGCSHSGICNIIEYAKKICGVDDVHDVIGGFHLLDPLPLQMEETVRYFDALNVSAIHACHCTDLSSKIKLSEVLEVLEVGVGLELNYE